MTKTVTWTCCLLSGLWLAGCAGSAPAAKHAATTPVSGTVTSNGTPVEGATVTLHPNQKGNGAFGVTDASGKYVLGTFEKTDGALPGEYKVSVDKLSQPAGGAQPAPGEPGYDPNPKVEKPKHLLPEKYADFTKSGLTATVSTTPVDNLDFKLD